MKKFYFVCDVWFQYMYSEVSDVICTSKTPINTFEFEVGLEKHEHHITFGCMQYDASSFPPHCLINSFASHLTKQHSTHWLAG
jgi:hypothetical protein